MTDTTRHYNSLPMKVQAWETEDATLVVWGTHDPATAYKVALAYYENEVGDVPEGLEDLLTNQGEKHWADPASEELEVWPDGTYGREPVEGWAPYLALDW